MVNASKIIETELLRVGKPAPGSIIYVEPDGMLYSPRDTITLTITLAEEPDIAAITREVARKK